MYGAFYQERMNFNNRYKIKFQIMVYKRKTLNIIDNKNGGKHYVMPIYSEEL